MMEKRGVIEPGRTPPEDPDRAEKDSLENHLDKRAAAEAAKRLKEATDGDIAKQPE